MSRIVSAMVACGTILLLVIGMAPAAHSEDFTIPLHQSFYRMHTDVEVHLLYVEVGEYQKGNTYTTTPLDKVKWFRLFFRYENHGDHTEDGYLQAEFYDEQGNQYKPNAGTYTGEDVKAGALSSIKFLEIPISKDSNIVKIWAVQGFDHEEFSVPVPGKATPTPEPTVAPTSTPSGTGAATVPPTPGSGGFCLLPFAILGIVGLAGLVAEKNRRKNN